jgi:hypothetical protein
MPGTLGKVVGAGMEKWRRMKSRRRSSRRHDDLKELIGRHEAQFHNLREDLKGITRGSICFWPHPDG